MKKRKLPAHISILGRKFKIKQVKRPSYNGQPILGLCDFPKKTIWLEVDQNYEDKKATLIHEASHAFLIVSDIDQRLTEAENEVWCQLISAFCEDIEKGIP